MTAKRRARPEAEPERPGAASIPAPLRRRTLFVAVAALALAGAAVALCVRTPQDPTRTGPVRTLVLGAFRVESLAGGGSRLLGEAATNLPDGARVVVELRTTEILVALETAVSVGRFEVATTAPGAVTNGTYEIAASFRLEDQPPALREALHFQPRRLDATGPLVVNGASDPGRELRPRLLALIADANAAEDAAGVARAAPRAAALERELWLSTLLPSVRRLRRALDQALREGPAPDLAALRREAVAAEVLARL